MDPDFTAYVILTQDINFGPIGPEKCAWIRENYGFTMPVLIDPEQQIVNSLGIPGNTKHIVMGPGNVITYRGSNPDPMHISINELLQD